MKLSIVWNGFTHRRAWLSRRVDLLRPALCLIFLLSLAVTGVAHASREKLAEVHKYLEAGKVEEARSALAGIVAREHVDSERLELLARLAEDVDSSFTRWFRALDMDANSDVVASSLIGLTDYALATEQSQLGLDLLNRHGNRARDSRLYSRLLINKVRLTLPSPSATRLEDELEHALREEKNDRVVAQLLLGLGDVNLVDNDYRSAQSFYQKLANRSRQRYAGMALMRMVEMHLRRGDIDNAHFAYTVLVTRYPGTPGIEELREMIESPQRVNPSDLQSSASIYAIRVGLYESIDEAEDRREEILSWGLPVQITRVLNDGSLSFIVDVGAFSTSAEALDFLSQLDPEVRDKLQVVKL